MKLYIPQLGDELKLAADWTFDLYGEIRNTTLFEVLGIEYPKHEEVEERKPGYWPRTRPGKAQITLPAGKVLKIDRIYIRKGQNDFNSVTFLLKGEKTKAAVKTGKSRWTENGVSRESTWTYKVPAKGVRFWAKLADVNTIEFEEVSK